MSKKTKENNQRLNRDAWIIAAFETLSDEGVNQVRIESLARKLGVTKGSFYWHFKNRDDLLDCLLVYWDTELTQTVLDHARTFDGDPIQRIFKTFEEIVGKERAKYDPVVRAWALHDKKAKRAVERSDKLRLSFLNGLFLDAGFTKGEADIRSRMLYYYALGEAFTTVKEPMKVRMAKVKRKAEILTKH